MKDGYITFEKSHVACTATTVGKKEADGPMHRWFDTIEQDEYFGKALAIAIESKQISASYLQRRLSVGYSRASRLIDQMEERRIIGPYEGTKPRQVLISRQEFNEMRMNEAE